MFKQENPRLNNITTNIIINNDVQKTKNFINEGYDKIIHDYEDIEANLSKMSHSVPNEFKNSFLKIINDLTILKDNIKNFILSINNHIATLANSNDSSTNNSDISKSLTITPRMKSSYDLISNEFDKLEKITKDIFSCNRSIKNKREKRILLLEKKLQQYCDDVKQMKFDNLQVEYDSLTKNFQNKQIISNYITKNNQIERYNMLGLDDANSSQSEIFFSEQSKKFNTSVHNEESITESEEANINNDTIVEEIIKNNPSKGEDMIQLIESILSKSNSKKKK